LGIEVDVDVLGLREDRATVAVNLHHVEFQIGYDTRGS
jgi:hypothetical protein